MASMSITVTPQNQQWQAAIPGRRHYYVQLRIKVTANSYTSKRYVHYKVIDNIQRSVYGGYISVAARATGTWSGTVNVFIDLASAGWPVPVTGSFSESFTIYTQVTTSTAAPGTSGWINKGSSSIVLPGRASHRFIVNGEETGIAYEGDVYTYPTAAGIRRFKRWKDSNESGISFFSPGDTRTMWGPIDVANTPFVHRLTSECYPIILKTKADGEWLDGSPKIKVDGSWIDPVDMFVKVDGEWKQA